ncbi:cupin domain-containing protein [Sphingomonas sp.]|jgi:quercetin dioxygenase-like cupin family protein|uniref:cupin domain-containing protein n=1 Tax=Sphingomonas sp. TaxID=28214 RepID=UPI002ED8E670
MHVTRAGAAREYHPPLHHGCTALRLQGMEASPADFAWVGLSHIAPGGGADMDAGPLGKIYVVLDGDVTVTLGNGESTTLGRLDSCYIAPGESRAVRNDGSAAASMIVVMPGPAPVGREDAA